METSSQAGEGVGEAGSLGVRGGEVENPPVVVTLPQYKLLEV